MSVLNKRAKFVRKLHTSISVRKRKSEENRRSGTVEKRKEQSRCENRTRRENSSGEKYLKILVGHAIFDVIYIKT